MNMLDSKCKKCGTDILLHQKIYKDPINHICYVCAIKEEDEGKDEFRDSDNKTFEEQLEHILINPDDYDLEYDLDDGWEIKCECGADKAGTPWHSNWCGKYKV